MPGIIVGVDGSENSRRALDWAISEAAVRRTPLTVLTVQQPYVNYWATPMIYPVTPDLVEEAREAVQKETDAALEQAPGARPPSVTVKATFGLPAEELLEAAADADLLVVGSRGAGGFRRLLVGSVSTQVTQHARCPVVVIPAVDA